MAAGSLRRRLPAPACRAHYNHQSQPPACLQTSPWARRTRSGSSRQQAARGAAAAAALPPASSPRQVRPRLQCSMGQQEQQGLLAVPCAQAALGYASLAALCCLTPAAAAGLERAQSPREAPLPHSRTPQAHRPPAAPACILLCASPVCSLKCRPGVPSSCAAGVDREQLSCEAAITVPLDCPKLLMRELVEKVAAETIMRGVPGARRTLRALRALRSGAGLGPRGGAAGRLGADGGAWGRKTGRSGCPFSPWQQWATQPPQLCEPTRLCAPSPSPLACFPAGVSKSYTLEAGAGGQQVLQTDGINIRGVWPNQVRWLGA